MLASFNAAELESNCRIEYIRGQLFWALEQNLLHLQVSAFNQQGVNQEPSYFLSPTLTSYGNVIQRRLLIKTMMVMYRPNQIIRFFCQNDLLQVNRFHEGGPQNKP